MGADLDPDAGPLVLLETSRSPTTKPVPWPHSDPSQRKLVLRTWRPYRSG